MTRGNKYKCYYCGQPENCTRDHFIPKSKTGFLTVWACRVCQASKGDLMPTIWLQYLKSHVLINKDIVVRIETAVTTLMDKINKKELAAHRPERIKNRLVQALKFINHERQ